MATNPELAEAVLYQLRGLVVVDKEHNIAFINGEYAKSIGISPETAVGRPVREVIPSSKLPLVVESGKPTIGDVFQIAGNPSVCNRLPLLKDGQIIGAMSFEVFSEKDTVLRLSKLVDSLREEVQFYQQELKRIQGAKYQLNQIRGFSLAITALRKTILKAAATNATVLIHGETGTGKELVAHAVHAESRRSHFPFVRVNCASIPAELIESELFGYESGAFTGARRGGKQGKFEAANRGTIFLDEVSQLTMSAQAKLLRVIQEREVERIGSNQALPIDCRVVAATNDDLAALVRKGKFREDLFYRLNVLPIQVPPLRERKDDIPDLARWFTEQLSDGAGASLPEVTDRAMAILVEYDWPGNVRELRNAIERAMSLTTTGVLDANSFEWLSARAEGREQQADGQHLLSVKHEAERDAITEAIAASHGNMTRAAELLGIDRSWLYRKMRRLNIGRSVRNGESISTPQRLV